MAQQFTLETTTNRQDNALAFAAQREGQTVDEYVQAWWADLVRRTVEQFVAQRSTQLVQAYLAADAATRGQVNDLLGL